MEYSHRYRAHPTREVAERLEHHLNVHRQLYLMQGESPAVCGVNEGKALVRTPEHEVFWGRA